MSCKKQSIKKDPSGHGYMMIDTSVGQKKFRVDAEVANYLLENQRSVTYDTFSDRYKFIFKDGKLAGKHTTLPRMIYAKFVANKDPTKIKGYVKCKNGIGYDFRTSNLFESEKKNEITARS